MSNLIVIAYPDESVAAQAMAKLQTLRQQFLIDYDDVAYVTRDANGAVRLTQSQPLTGAAAASGSLWGLLVGTLFLMPLAGAAIGAATGAVVGKTADIGIDDAMMKRIGSELVDARSALFILVRSANAEKVLPEMASFGGKIIQTSLNQEAEANLRKAIEGKAAFDRMSSQVVAQQQQQQAQPQQSQQSQPPPQQPQQPQPPAP